MQWKSKTYIRWFLSLEHVEKSCVNLNPFPTQKKLQKTNHCLYTLTSVHVFGYKKISFQNAGPYKKVLTQVLHLLFNFDFFFPNPI